jgi:hypothetical protein
VTSPAPEHPSEYRQPLWLRVVVSLPLAAAAVYLVASGVATGGGALVTGAILAAVMVAVIVRSWQLKLALGDEVTVVNWRQTHRLTWTDVERFGYDRSGLWILRRNKQKVAVAAFALGRGLPSVRRHGGGVMEQLEEIRKERRKPRPGAGRGRARKR